MSKRSMFSNLAGVLASAALFGCAAEDTGSSLVDDSQPYDPEETAQVSEGAVKEPLASNEGAGGLITKGAGSSWQCSGGGGVSVECKGGFDHCRGEVHGDIRCSGQY